MWKDWGRPLGGGGFRIWSQSIGRSVPEAEGQETWEGISARGNGVNPLWKRALCGVVFAAQDMCTHLFWVRDTQQRTGRNVWEYRSVPDHAGTWPHGQGMWSLFWGLHPWRSLTEDRRARPPFRRAPFPRDVRSPGRWSSAGSSPCLSGLLSAHSVLLAWEGCTPPPRPHRPPCILRSQKTPTSITSSCTSGPRSFPSVKWSWLSPYAPLLSIHKIWENI